jgi:hypothetical protein
MTTSLPAAYEMVFCRTIKRVNSTDSESYRVAYVVRQTIRNDVVIIEAELPLALHRMKERTVLSTGEKNGMINVSDYFILNALSTKLFVSRTAPTVHFLVGLLLHGLI